MEIMIDRTQIIRDLGRAGRFLDRAARYSRDKNPLEIAIVALALVCTEDQVRAEDDPPPPYDRLAILREIARAPQFLDQAIAILQAKLPPEFHPYVTDFCVGRLALALAFGAPEEPIVQRIYHEIAVWIGHQTDPEQEVEHAE